MMASAGCLQGWNGLTIHTYRYRTCGPMDRLGAVVMDGVGYRVNFDTFNDPAKFGLFYNAALLFRRGDVSPARETLAVRVPENAIELEAAGVKRVEGKPDVPRTDIPALRRFPETRRVGLLLPGCEAPADREVAPSEEPAEVPGQDLLSDTGQLHRNHRKGVAWIDTPRTKAAYGFLGETDPIELDGLKLTVRTGFAVLGLSSLTDEPLNRSDHMLLTAVGRADNTGARYNPEHTERLDIGHGPVLIEVIRAELELVTEQPDLQVWSVDPLGFLTGRIPAEYRDGRLSFEIGEAFPSMYYLVQR
jgi:hypothetical protein